MYFGNDTVASFLMEFEMPNLALIYLLDIPKRTLSSWAWLRFGFQGAREMDYNLAALKLLCVQLKDAQETSSENAMELHNIIFQRAWLQVRR